MISKRQIKNLVWIDLDQPTEEELKRTMAEYKIPARAAEDMLSPTAKPRVETYGNFIYMILHFPALKHTHKISVLQEVDILVGKEILVTVHYDTVDPLHKFAKVFEVNAVLDKDDTGYGRSLSRNEHAGFLAFALIRKLYKAVIHELEYLSDTIHDIEGRVFEGKEKEMVMEISKVSRGLLNIKQILGMHKDTLDTFKEACAEFFGQQFITQARNLLEEYYRSRNMLDNNIAILDELRETNNSLVSTKQNEVMKVLTIMAFVTFPLSLLASIFGMNTSFLPFVGHQFDFWIVIGMMVLLTTCFFAFFKYKRWL